MTDNSTIWKALQEFLPKRTWISLAEIFATVRARVALDKEDLVRASNRSASPHWEVNVRRLLRSKLRSGGVSVRKRPQRGN